LETNAWIENLDILSTQHYQIKTIYAANEQTLEFEFIFLIWYFCVPCLVRHKQMFKWPNIQRPMNFSKHANVSMSHQWQMLLLLLFFFISCLL